jgi:hypothetical protein
MLGEYLAWRSNITGGKEEFQEEDGPRKQPRPHTGCSHAVYLPAHPVLACDWLLFGDDIRPRRGAKLIDFLFAKESVDITGIMVKGIVWDKN